MIATAALLFSLVKHFIAEILYKLKKRGKIITIQKKSKINVATGLEKKRKNINCKLRKKPENCEKLDICEEFDYH